MPQFPRFGAEAPVCPICDGPCKEHFERSPYVFPDQLRHTDAEGKTIDPAKPESRPKPPNKRARRLAEDRMHRPAEDR